MKTRFRVAFRGRFYEVRSIDFVKSTATILEKGKEKTIPIDYDEHNFGRALGIYDAYGRELYIGDVVLAPVISLSGPGFTPLPEDPDADFAFRITDSPVQPAIHNTFREWQYPKGVVNGKVIPENLGAANNAHIWLVDGVIGLFPDTPLSFYEMNPKTGRLKNVRALRNGNKCLPDYATNQDYRVWLSGACEKDDSIDEFNPRWRDFSLLRPMRMNKEKLLKKARMIV